MSYFMTVAGNITALKLDNVTGFSLVPVNEAQEYIQNLAGEIQAADGSPLFLVADGESGTSHDIVCDAENNLKENGTLEGTIMLNLMQQFAKNGNAFRVWWAGNGSQAHNSGEVFSSLNEIVAKLEEQAYGRDIQIRFMPIKASE
jgi:hypothetical protein